MSVGPVLSCVNCCRRLRGGCLHWFGRKIRGVGLVLHAWLRRSSRKDAVSSLDPDFQGLLERKEVAEFIQARLGNLGVKSTIISRFSGYGEHATPGKQDGGTRLESPFLNRCITRWKIRWRQPVAPWNRCLSKRKLGSGRTCPWSNSCH